MKLSPFQILALGGVAIAGFLVFRAVRAGATVLQAINPASDQNIVNRGFNELTGATDRGSSLGSDIFDFFQRLRGIPEFDPNAPVGRAETSGDLRRGATTSPIGFAPEVEQIVRGKNDRRRIFVPPSPPNQTAVPNPPIQGAEI